MLEIDSDALKLVLAALGRGTPATATRPLAFQDELLQQTLDVRELIRRAGVVQNGLDDGIWTMILSNTHAGATTESTGFNVDSIGGTVAAFPQPIPANMDLWLLAASAKVGNAPGNFTDAYLVVGHGADYSLDGSGAAFTLMNTWNATIGGLYIRQENDTNPRPPLRLTRNASVTFVSTSSGAGDYQCHLVFGLFPRALGQDALGVS
jgi:hypothetical protein